MKPLRIGRVPRLERAEPRAGERRRFAGAVAASRRLRCGARSPRRAHKLGLGYEASNSVHSSPLRRATSACCAPRRSRGAPPLTHPRPCGTGSCLSRTASDGCSKAGVDGCGGAYAALSIAAQRGQSDVPVGPARRIYAAARSAPLRSHRSRPAEREAQGTRSAAEGAASKPELPSAPALPLHSRHACQSHKK